VRALPENRHALLIATTTYKDKDLRQLAAPGADVRALAEVLKDPAVGRFNVKAVIDKSWWVVQQVIARFFANCDPKDTLLLYFSCHGIKNDDGHLYFATTDTNRKILRASAIPDDFVQEQMRTSAARQQVLILDCCYGGYFTSQMLAKADENKVDDIDRFQAHGAAILTGSNAIQYSFESDGLKNRSKLSVFTGALVKGLSSGAADLDGDGWISAVDLFGYTRTQMRSESRTQTPTLSTIGQEGEIYIAAVPPSRRKKDRMGPPFSASADGWIDLSRFVNRSPEAVDRDAVILAMETSLAIYGKRVSLSTGDLRKKLTKLSKRKPDTDGFVMGDMMYLIDHVGIRAERSKTVYTARSYRLDSLNDIVGQLRLGRPVVVGLTWRRRWLEEPIVKTGKLELRKDESISGGSMITIVGYNEEEKAFRFVWYLSFGDRGIGWMSIATARSAIHGSPYSIEAAEITVPYTKR